MSSTEDKDQRALGYVTQPRFLKTVTAIPYLRHQGEPLDRMAKWTLTILVQRADWDSWESLATNSELAALGSMSEPSVERGLAILVRAGYVQRYAAKDGGGWKTRILVDRILADARLFLSGQPRRREFEEAPWKPSEPRRNAGSKGSKVREGPQYEEGRVINIMTLGPHIEEGCHHPDDGGSSNRGGEGPQSDPLSIIPSRSVSTRPLPVAAGGGESVPGSRKEGSGPPITLEALVAYWNAHPGRALGVARLTLRISLPPIFAEVPAELAQRAIDAYMEHAGETTAEWEPMGMGWPKFLDWSERIVQWLLRPTLPVPGMGRRRPPGGRDYGKSTDAGTRVERATRHAFTGAGRPRGDAGVEGDLDELF